MRKSFLPGLIIIILLSFSLSHCNNSPDNPPSNVTNVKTPDSFHTAPVKSYPHDTSSFTEGLLMYKGFLYESTGLAGKSKLLKIDLATGKPVMQVKLEDRYFGEGISILNDTLYQLTYQEHVVLVYDVKTFKKIKEFPLDLAEGWGMTTDGVHLIVSDGTSNLYYYDPTTFKQVKKLAVTDAGTPGYNINELEFINGFIYANQWQLPYILKIDTASGEVVAKSDITDIWQRVNHKNGQDVPNGIAYDSATKKTYITGKNWPVLYEVNFQ